MQAIIKALQREGTSYQQAKRLLIAAYLHEQYPDLHFSIEDVTKVQASSPEESVLSFDIDVVVSNIGGHDISAIAQEVKEYLYSLQPLPEIDNPH